MKSKNHNAENDVNKLDFFSTKMQLLQTLITVCLCHAQFNFKQKSFGNRGLVEVKKIFFKFVVELHSTFTLFFFVLFVFAEFSHWIYKEFSSMTAPRCQKWVSVYFYRYSLYWFFYNIVLVVFYVIVSILWS